MGETLQPASDLWQRAARALSGHDVTVYFATPQVVGAAATFERMEEGGRILIDPQYLGRPVYVLFLFFHECAHALLDWHYQAITQTAYAPLSQEYPEEFWERYSTSPTESRADKLADGWTEQINELAGEKSATHWKLQAIVETYEQNPEWNTLIGGLKP
ncbi:hypothetical protein EHM76_00445 [bacterium]|nr:MAG: hypothetical protein EHM76_00445 [bacterium]